MPMYPPGVPTVAGTAITVDAFLNNPTRVQRAITDLTLNRFLADQIFATGPQAQGGAVLFDQLSAGAFFTDRDVQQIEAGSEFPVVDSGDITPLVAAVAKWGGSALVTYEASRRDRRDLLNRALTRLRNTIIRKVDTVAIAALDASPINTMAGSGDWTTAATDIISDIETGRSTVNNNDMGYVIDTVLLNPAQELDIRRDADIRAALPRENMTQNLLNARGLSGLLGIPNWFVSNRQAAGTVRLLQSKIIGSISDELALYSRVVDEQTRERYRVMAARVAVPYVTDPKAAINITGV